MVFIPLENLFSLHRDQRVFRSRWTTDVIYLLLNGILIKIGLGTLIVAFIYISSFIIPREIQIWVEAQSFWLQVPAIIILSDLGFYSMHRFFHANPRLWKFHSVHHSIEHMDWLAAHRVHPIDQILTKFASLVPVFAFGFAEGPIVIYATLYFWHSLLLHSNTRINFGPLGWLLASPQFHHWHHANQPEAFDKNFAGQISFLDKLFGTFYVPGRDMPRQYGVDDPVPHGYLRQLAYPFTTQADANASVSDVDRTACNAGDPKPTGPSESSLARGSREWVGVDGVANRVLEARAKHGV